MGPVPSPMERQGDRYRAQLLLRSTLARGPPGVPPALGGAARSRPDRRAGFEWSLDVDPIELG